MGLSAGRVQSVALKLVCEREDEIEAFVKEEYWNIEAELTLSNGEKIKAKLEKVDGMLRRLSCCGRRALRGRRAIRTRTSRRSMRGCRRRTRRRRRW